MQNLDNILPYDGIAHFHGRVFNQGDADQFFHELLSTIHWEHDTAIMFGRKIITKRKIAWYGDRDYSYTYSKTTRHALPWTETLIELKARAEDLSGERYNSCLLNLYHSGEEGMAWHRDEEYELKKDGAIASMSFGAERKFSFKHRRDDERLSIILPHGSLLIMKGETQSHWLHCLPKTKKVKNPRINLTFRTMKE